MVYECSNFTNIYHKPGELALSCNPSYLREARTVGWLEVKRLKPPGRRDSAAELWSPCGGTVNGRRSSSYYKRRPCWMLQHQKTEFEPQARYQHSQTQFLYCNCVKRC